MHKDISQELTVSTCLLKSDRNCVSDFTETPPPLPWSHMCPSLTLPLAAGDSAAEKPHLEKSVLEMSAWDGKSTRLEVLVLSLVAHTPGPWQFFLCSVWILAAHIMKFRIWFHTFFQCKTSSQLLNATCRKPNAFYSLRYYFLFFMLTVRKEMLSGLITWLLHLTCAHIKCFLKEDLSSVFVPMLYTMSNYYKIYAVSLDQWWNKSQFCPCLFKCVCVCVPVNSKHFSNDCK